MRSDRQRYIYFLPESSLIQCGYGLETEHSEVTKSSFKDRVRPFVPLQPLLQKFPAWSEPAN